MRKILTAAAMQRADQRTMEEREVPSAVLMEKAAMAVAEEIQRNVSPAAGPVYVVCGNGNNGGDGIAVARLLFLAGFTVRFLMAMGEERLSCECGRQLRIARHYGVPEAGEEEAPALAAGAAVLVDALFGIGLSRPIEGRLARLAEEMNRTRGLRVAVDIPSGVDASTGRILGTAFQADVTVTMAYEKVGQILYPGRKYCGRVVTADIGIYAGEEEREVYGCLEPGDFSWLFDREEDGNKGTFGKLLLVAGSPGMAGAAQLSSLSALRAGAGMVKAVTPPENILPLQVGVPEAMVDASESEKSWEADLAWCDGLCVGPGLGQEERALEKLSFFLKGAKERNLPLVLDADGLNLLAGHPSLRELLPAECVLTPHLGEAARLLGGDISSLKENLPAAAGQIAKLYGCTVILKDASTLTVSPEGENYLLPGGNPALATAGSGDVLAGLTGAALLLGRGKKSLPLRAASAAALHGVLGEWAAKSSPFGRVIAGDLPRQLSFLRGGIEWK